MAGQILHWKRPGRLSVELRIRHQALFPLSRKCIDRGISRETLNVSYTGHYRWDIFISYSRRDNQTTDGGGRGWISQFVNDLQCAIETYLGEDIAVFFDLRDVKLSEPLDQYKDTIKEAATMTVFASPTYSKSEWTLADLDAFTARNESRRLFVVKMLPKAEGEWCPASIDGVVGWTFWQQGTHAARPLRRNTDEYHSSILDLADALQRKLRAIRNAEPAAYIPPPEAPSKSQSAAYVPPTEAPSKPRIFLSYSGKDRDRIRPLAERLEQAGHEVWWDPHIDMGTPFRKVIAAQLEKAQVVLVAWSFNSVDSDWVQEEAEEGKRRGCLRPVLIDPVRPPIGFRSYQTLDIRGWDQKIGDAIISRLLEQLSRVPPVAP